jgi:hypothetical protein
MTHDELQKVRNALAVATTHFARDRIIVLDAIVIVNNALAEPSQRTWVGLTDDEHCDIWYKESLDWMEYGKAIEAKLKEKNT